MIVLVSIRILVKVIKISNIHSTLLASVGSLTSTVESTTDSADGASVSLVHLRVTPCYAILDTLALRAWLSRLLSYCAHSVRLVRLGLVVHSRVIVYVLHRLCADPDS